VLDNPTIEKLKEMKLKVMAQMLREPDTQLTELSFEERLGIMVEKEWMSRKNSRIKRLLYSASLGINACMEDIDYTTDRNLDKKMIQTLSACSFYRSKAQYHPLWQNRFREVLPGLCLWKQRLSQRLHGKILPDSRASP